MKLIDEKGRLFGKVNIVDLLVVLLLVLIIAGVCWKLFAPAVSDAVAPQVTMTTTLRIRGASPMLIDELERNPQTGKQLVAGNDYIAGTKVISVDYEPYVVQVQTADGRIEDATDPSKQDVIVVIESSVAKGTATPKIGNQEIRAGRTMIFKTNDFEVSANIDSVVFGE